MISLKKVDLFSIEIDNLTLNESVNKVIQMAMNKNKYDYVVTPNVDHIVTLQKDSKFMKIYKNASLILADGQPLVWISRLLGKPLSEKVSGSDIFPLICGEAAKNNLKVFLLGAKKNIAGKAAKNLIKKFPLLNIAGVYSPSFGFDHNIEENKKIIRMINNSSTDILFVGVGAPKQEKWIYDHLNELKVPVSLGIGASFDFEANVIKRAPIWMRNVGLEWIWRLSHEPRRLYKRYFIDTIIFGFLIIKEIKLVIKRHLVKD